MLQKNEEALTIFHHKSSKSAAKMLEITDSTEMYKLRLQGKVLNNIVSCKLSKYIRI